MDKFYFLRIWPLAHLFHFQLGYLFHHSTSYQELLLSILVYGVALICLIFPTFLSLFFLALAQIVEASFILPDITNHWLLVTLVNINLVIHFIFLCLINKNYENFWQNFSKSTMLSVIFFYFWTFAWKANFDFLDYQISCATKFSSLLYIPPEFILLLIPFIILTVEALFPILLGIRKYRRAGAFIAILFHGALIFPIERFFLNFSFVMLPLLVLFLAEREDLRQESNKIPVKNILQLVAINFLLLILVAIQKPESWFVMRQVLALILYFVITAAVISKYRNWSIFSLRPSYLWSLLIPILVLFNGLSPIIGLKNASAWQMYSNIDITEESSNHLWFKRSLDIHGYLADRVKVISSKELESGTELPYLALLKSCSLGKCNNLEYLRGGIRYQTNGLKEAEEYDNLSIMERKIYRFIPFNPEGVNCNW